MSTYNKLKPIYIGGSTNTISSSVGDVSLRVSGNTFLDGNVNITGVASDLSTTISTINNKTTPLSYSSGVFGVGSNNSFNATAVTNPININGLSSGAGDDSNYSTFNLSINSWYSVGFVDTCNKVCNILFNLRSGNINFKGGLNDISATTFNYLYGVTSNIQNQLNDLKQKTTNLNFNSTNGYTYITGGAFAFFGSVVMNYDVIFQTNLNGISTTTFNYLSGVTSNIQNQFNTLTSNLSTTNTNLQSQITSNTNNITSNTNNITTLQSLTNGASSNLQTQITTNKNNVDSSLNVINSSIDTVYTLIQNQNVLLANLGNIGSSSYTYYPGTSKYGLWVMNIGANRVGKYSGNPSNIYFQCSFYCYFSPGSTLVTIIFNPHTFTITPSTSGASISIYQGNVSLGIDDYSLYGYNLYN